MTHFLIHITSEYLAKQVSLSEIDRIHKSVTPQLYLNL